jgi:hypothetical protein
VRQRTSQLSFPREKLDRETSVRTFPAAEKRSNEMSGALFDATVAVVVGVIILSAVSSAAMLAMIVVGA